MFVKKKFDLSWLGYKLSTNVKSATIENLIQYIYICYAYTEGPTGTMSHTIANAAKHFGFKVKQVDRWKWEIKWNSLK